MEKLPNMGQALKILSVLEKNIFQEISLHQLSKQVNLDYKTTCRTSRQLLQLGLLNKNVRGKGHFVSLNLNHYDIKTYLSLAAYCNRMAYFQKNSGLTFLREEIKQLQLRDSCLVLFGSQVTSTQSRASDIDLLLLTNNTNSVVKVKALLSNYNLKTDLNVLAFKHYLRALQSREFNLANQVLGKHIILHDPERYWELTLRGLKNGNRY